MLVPFNKLTIVGRELTNIRKAVLSHSHLSGDGPFTRWSEKHLEQIHKPAKVLLTSSCTHALELAAMLAEIQEGDEVIVPSYTFPSTVNAFVLRGAIPRFVDVRPDTFNIDEEKVTRAITRKTKALCVVHYGGVPAEMTRLQQIARSRNIFLIEDAAQAFTSEFRNKKAGTLSDFGTLSFHETKNVICGEGGALIINNKKFVRRAEILRQKGTNRAAFYRGEVDKYTWVDVGSSYVPSELQAAFLAAQLEKKNVIWKRRKQIWDRYWEALRALELRGDISLQKIPDYCRSSYHLFAVVLESERKRQTVIEELKRKGVYAIFHYFPLHLSKMGRRYGYHGGELPETERISRCLLRLPMYHALDWSSQRHVIETLISCL